MENNPIKNILGADPNDNNKLGPEIANDLAARWNNYLTQGLDKETKASLLEKWLIPVNCNLLQGPQLNPEVQVMLSPTDQKRDAFMMELQMLMGKGLAALGGALSNLININMKENNPQEDPDPNLLAIAEAGQLFCHVHNTISGHRKFQLYPHFNAKIQKIAATQLPDAFLFGEAFAEKCKNVKAFENTAKELKAGPTEI